MRLESHDPDLKLIPGTTKSDIVAFLYRNDEYGYSPIDIHTALEVPHYTAKVTLKRLYDDEYLDKTSDSFYHARPDREDLYRYTAALAGLDRMFASPEHAEATESDVEELPHSGRDESASLTDEDIDQAVALVESDDEAEE